MQIPVIFLTVVVMVIIYNFSLNYYQNKMRKKFEEYVDNENVQNIVPRAKLQEIEYIVINESDFSFLKKEEFESNPHLLEHCNRFFELIGLTMADFHGKTNHELKQTYGVNNMRDVLAYDENYTTLTSYIIEFATILLMYHHTKEAISILDLGVRINTTISKNYILLAELYHKNKLKTNLFNLIDTIKANNEISQKKILDEINKIIESNKE